VEKWTVTTNIPTWLTSDVSVTPRKLTGTQSDVQIYKKLLHWASCYSQQMVGKARLGR